MRLSRVLFGFSALLGSMAATAMELPQDCALRMVRELIGDDVYFLDRAAETPKFQAYLKAKKLDWNSLNKSAKYKTTRDYLIQYFKRYSPSQLVTRQERSLGQALQAHGFAPGAASRQALRKQSAINLARVLPQRYAYGVHAEMKEAEKLVSQIRLAFPHNVRNAVSSAPEGLLLSSEQLSKLGTGGGLNSKLPFTRQFMGQSDQVFFFADILHPRYPYPTFQYGDFGYVLSSQTAKEQGWISGFVMYPEDLYSAAGRLLPETEFAALAQAEKASRAPWAGPGGRSRQLFEFTPEQRTTWQRARQALHRADFTVEDFEILVKEKLLTRLNEIRAQDPQAFSKWMGVLRDPGTDLVGWNWGWKQLLDEVVFRPSGLPAAFELKIPVAVDPTSLTVHARGVPLKN